MDYCIFGLAQRLRTGMMGGHEDTGYTSKRFHGANCHLPEPLWPDPAPEDHPAQSAHPGANAVAG